MSDVNGNAALYFVERHRAGDLADKTAFVEGIADGRALTYGELAKQSDCMAGLFARHDLRREDRAAILVLDKIEYPVLFWGSLKAGVIPILLNTLLGSEVYDTILRDCRARALFVSAELLPVVEPVLKGNPFLKAIFVVGASVVSATSSTSAKSSVVSRLFAGSFRKEDRGASDYLDFAEEISRSAPSALVTASPDEHAFWLYSSGSTGAPKGVQHVHSSMQATADTYGRHVAGLTQDDTVYSAAKIFFAYGLGNAMTFPMAVGATTVLFPGRPTPDAVFDVMARTRPTVFFGVPTLYAAMLAAFGESVPEGLERLRRSFSAGEALPADIGSRWSQAVGTDIFDGVGSTELLHIFLSNAPGDLVYGSSGRPVAGYDVRLVDENDSEVEPGAIGELLVRGASAASGYWNQREKSRTTFEGEWTRTGDKYQIADDGRFVYCGRTDDMFKVSGIWVSPFEVEQALVSHPLVLEAAVVAQRDEEGLEKPKAFVVLTQVGADDNLATALKQHVKDSIGKWKYPRWIEIVDELPKTATGKIQRFKLRAVDEVAP